MESGGSSSMASSADKPGDESLTLASGASNILSSIASTIPQVLGAIPDVMPEIAPMGLETALSAEQEEQKFRLRALEILKAKEEEEVGVSNGASSVAESSGWPSVSDAEEEEEEEDSTSLKTNKYPVISEELLKGTFVLEDEASNREPSVIVRGLESGGEESNLDGESSEALQARRDLLLDDDESTGSLKDLRARRALSEDDSSQTGSRIMLDTEERGKLPSRQTYISEEEDSSSGSIFHPEERERIWLKPSTYEVLDDGFRRDWLGAEEVLGADLRGTNGLDYTPHRPFSTEESVRREVYKFPKREDELLTESEQGQSQLLAWPAGIIIQVIAFQFKLLLQPVYFALWALSFTYAMITFPFRTTVQVTNLVSTTVSDGYTLATQIKPMVKEGVSQAGPILKQTTRRCGCGCLAAAYVIFMLGSLMFPAFFMDLFLMRSFIEEPVEFREVLHFDYTKEHPAAIMPLLPPKVLARGKEYTASYPEKIFYVRAIPQRHKFHVTVFLTLPESDYNRRLGIFQVSAELLSVRGQVLKRASWPCMLRFRSSPIRYAKNLLLGVPLLMGLSWETQTLALRILENQQEKTIPTAMVRIVLEPKAGIMNGAGLPEIYSAEAQVLSVLPWMKNLIRNWKWTFYVWSGLGFFMFEVLLVLCCCHQLLLPSSILRGITEGFGESSPGRVPFEEAAPRKGAKHNRRVNFSDKLPTARALRLPIKSVDEFTQRELLFSKPESVSTLSGPRYGALSGTSIRGEDMGYEATSSWTVPPLEETLDYVDNRVRSVEDTVRSLGETVVEGVTEGVGLALDTLKGLEPKDLKSD